MDERQNAWSKSTASVNTDEWNAGRVVEDVRRITAGCQQRLQELDDEYRRNRSQILDDYAYSVSELLARSAATDVTQQIVPAKLENGVY
jgi:hypothetical protein